ncbi:MAG: diguanylate cyclase, partial [Firmicutes bacterium]|nr:diguanylate cyclase [Bacillota bacterium]
CSFAGTQSIFPEILTLNLTQRTYRMMNYDALTTLGTPKEGAIDEMLSIRYGGVVAEDLEAFKNTFNYDNLQLKFGENKEDSISLVYRRPDKNGRPIWFETSVFPQPNPFDEDILLIALSKNISSQKAEEQRLKDELRIRSEELRLTMAEMGKIITHYDVPRSTLYLPDSVAFSRNLKNVMPGFPKCLENLSEDLCPDETINSLTEFFENINSGSPAGACEVFFGSVNGQPRWERWEYKNVFDQDKNPISAIISIDDITDEYLRKEENRRLKENEHFMTLIAQHSDRTVYYYDIKLKSIRMWSSAFGAEIAPAQNLSDFCADINILPESRADFEKFFDDIHAGVPNGEVYVNVLSADGEKLWFDWKYSTSYDSKMLPSLALISSRDITLQHEQELAYLRHLQSLEESERNAMLIIESNLSANAIEKIGGSFMKEFNGLTLASQEDFFENVLGKYIAPDNLAEAKLYFDKNKLLEEYKKGTHHMNSIWKIIFSSGEHGWVDVFVELLEDPFTKHIKALYKVSDITRNKEEELKILHLSEHDGMTGLYNRAASDRRISEFIYSRDISDGILILVDLDDLKKINDTFGHTWGDFAIRSVADTLKSHFRGSDIIGRMGGDEFILFLPGAGKNIPSIINSLGLLLRRLSGISVGENNEMRIHCSIGCTLFEANKGQSYEKLFREADLALYQVKRSGKNSFAFYTPEMESADYSFQREKVFAFAEENVFDRKELFQFMKVLSAFYPMIFSMNLSTNCYYLVSYDEAVFSDIPPSGSIDLLINSLPFNICEEDVPAVREWFESENQFAAYQRGEKSVRISFRYLNRLGAVRWGKIISIFYINEHGDVCNFSLCRNMSIAEYSS